MERLLFFWTTKTHHAVTQQQQALAAICDTFVGAVPAPHGSDPDGYWSRSASDQGVPQRLLDLIAGLKAEDQAQFAQLLQLISSPLLGLTWGGPLRPAHRLRPEQRQKMLQSWSCSRLALLRNAFNTLRRAATFLYFGDVPAGHSANPNNATIGYHPPGSHLAPDPQPIPTVDLNAGFSTLHLTCDVLVVGSGSGGGVVAATLAAAGRDVLVVEKGGYTPRGPGFTRQEFPMLHRHFEAGALLTTRDGSLSVLAGSTLGGGSAINWAGSLRTPDYVLEEWANEHHNPHFATTEYRAGFEEIERRMSVNTDLQHNPQNQALLDAAQQLGWNVGNIPMNLRLPADVPTDLAWQAAGFSCIGDAYGIKQGVHETFLKDATRDGARVLVGTQLQRLTVERGTVTGAEGVATRPDGSRVNVQIRAQQVVVSAGSLHTPVLLLKSGLTHPQIGRNLFLHPVVPVAAFLDRETLPWYGPMMSVIVHEFARLDGNWGFRIECPPIHPGLGASALSWESAAQLKADLLQARQLAVNFCLVRDRFGGRVTVGKRSGEPVLDYHLHPYDRQHLLRGIREAIVAHQAAAAREVLVPHNEPLRLRGDQPLSAEAIDALLQQRRWDTARMGLFSAHQMGTCRMGGTRDYPVQPNGETREVRGLFVADASLFPSASGANPMLSVKALALHVAKGMV
jgi:choline dehydrogenase-like flavoprotein